MAEKPRRRITVVNDNPQFLELMSTLLEEGSGYQTTTIDGDELTSMAPISQSRPDLLIVDLVLRPDGISGWDVLSGVRRVPELASVPIIICTGDVYAVRQRAAELADAPGVELLVKPFNIDALEELVARLLATAPPAGPPWTPHSTDRQAVAEPGAVAP